MKDDAFRQELVRDPKTVFARDLGVTMPDSIQVQVVEESATHRYLVLPQRPASADVDLSEEELDDVAGGVRTMLRQESCFNCPTQYC